LSIFHVFFPDPFFSDLFGIADILLSRGANVGSMSSEGTPLHIAAQCGNVEMMEVLLKYKANVLISFFPSLLRSLSGNVWYSLYSLIS
jgi:ankyrin repeat protein